MKKLLCKAGPVVRVDDEDYEWLSLISWYYVKTENRERIMASNPTRYMHTEILKKHKMHIPGKDIRFINGNSLDFRKDNLKLINRSESTVRREPRKNRSTGIRGIIKHGNYYIVRTEKGSQVYFKDIEKAILYQEYYLEALNDNEQ